MFSSESWRNREESFQDWWRRKRHITQLRTLYLSSIANFPLWIMEGNLSIERVPIVNTCVSKELSPSRSHKVWVCNKLLYDLVGFRRFILDDGTYQFHRSMRWIFQRVRSLAISFFFSNTSAWIETPMKRVRGFRIIRCSIFQATFIRCFGEFPRIS